MSNKELKTVVVGDGAVGEYHYHKNYNFEMSYIETICFHLNVIPFSSLLHIITPTIIYLHHVNNFQ